MKKQTIFTIFAVVLLGLAFSFYQYSETFKTEVASATSTVPNPGHLWSSMECNSDTLCVDTVNNRLGIGTASPGTKLDVNGGIRAIGSGFTGATGKSAEIQLYSNTAYFQGYDRTGDAFIPTYFRGNPIILEGGNVGIGTTVPKTQLHLGTELPVLSIGAITTYGGSSGNAMAAITSTLTAGGQTGGSLNFQTNPWGVIDSSYVPVTMMTILPRGNVGIGTTSPSYNLTVAGTAWVTSGSWSGSDARWKKNVSTLSTASSLDKILALNSVNYEWKTDEYPEMKFSSGAQLGFIAQEVEPIIPEVVTTDNNGYKGISYEKIVPVLTSAMQEQQKEIEQLKTMVCLDHPLTEICK